MRSESPRNKTVSPRTRRLRVAGALGALLAATLMTGCGQNSGDDTSTATSEAAKVMPNQSGSASASPSSTAQLTEEQTKRKDVLSKVKITFDKAATTAVGEVAGGKLTALGLEGLDGSGKSASPSPKATGTASPSDTASPSHSPSGSPSPSGNSTAPKWMAQVAETDGTVHIVTIDAVSGDVLDSKPEANQSDADKQQTADRIAKVKEMPQQAAQVATDKKKGIVTSVDLDENDSQTLVWKVDVVTKDWKMTTFDVDAEDGKITNEQVKD
ncbi:PepSY domain-containing protein [Streptomyces halstedii]|uniref:PepSY domain-containing protein n=1 Tax=Streptomyces halstedii TaxID=1944 RepID=UPI00367B0983